MEKKTSGIRSRKVNVATLGRKGVVQNLLNHLLRGTSAVVAGGPKMGKTTLLHQASAGLSESLKTVYIDLSRDRPDDPARSIPGGPDSVILLLDGCEALLPDPMPFVNNIARMFTPSEKNRRAVVWAGGVLWGEWAMAHRSDFGRPIRFYPLVLLPPKEARPFLKDSLLKEPTPAELKRLLERAGGHPYLLSRVLEKDGGRDDAFFSTLWRAAESPMERFLLTELVRAGSWVRLEELKDAVGARPPKKVLDHLATLGVINRTLIEGAAAVKIVSPIFGEWVRRTTREQKGSKA
jgi:hypothetical protein